MVCQHSVWPPGAVGRQAATNGRARRWWTYKQRKRLLELGDLLLGERISLRLRVSRGAHARGAGYRNVLQGGVCDAAGGARTMAAGGCLCGGRGVGGVRDVQRVCLPVKRVQMGSREEEREEEVLYGWRRLAGEMMEG